jgi:hypothetical protein
MSSVVVTAQEPEFRVNAVTRRGQHATGSLFAIHSGFWPLASDYLRRCELIDIKVVIARTPSPAKRDEADVAISTLWETTDCFAPLAMTISDISVHALKI